MNTICYPKFVGSLEVASTNKEVKFEDGGGPHLILLPEGTFQLDLLLTILVLSMNGASANDYAATVSESGKIAISGLAPWAPDLEAGYPNFWTGGDGLPGTQRDNHLGWKILPSAQPLATIQTAPGTHSRGFYPDQPIQEDDEFIPQSTVAEFWSIGGKGSAFDFTGATIAADTRNIAFRLLSAESKDQFTNNFWRNYAKQGSPSGVFQFFEDRTLPDYELYVLTGDSLRRVPWSRSIAAHPYWSLPLSLRRYIP